MKTDNLKLFKVPSGASMIQKLLKYSSNPDYISFALGFPSFNSFPLKQLSSASLKILKNKNSLQYQPPCSELKKFIVDLMRQKMIFCDVDQIFLTSGAQQGLSLVASLFLSSKKNYLLAEEVVYTGFLQAIKPFNPQILSLNLDYESRINIGLIKQKIKNLLQADYKPSLLYLITEGHNPLGGNVDIDNLKEIKKILELYQLFAIEDDPYGFINYEEPNIKLKSLVPDNVFYVGSFSKILAPSLRVGWIVAPKKYLDMIANIKEGADLNISSFSQRLILNYIEQNNFNNHINSICTLYKAKRDLMVSTLKEYFGNKVKFSIPSSGIFIWVNFERKINSEDLLNAALEAKVVYLPGNSFIIDSENKKFDSSIRLCFSFCEEEQIVQGIKRLKIAYDKI